MKPTLSLALILAFAAAPALAEEPDAPTATAPPGVADQIAAFLRDSPATDLPASPARAAPAAAAPDRRPHGVVEVAVGNHGYRSVYLETHMPVGDAGEISIAVGERGGGYGGRGRRFTAEPDLAVLPAEVVEPQR